MSLLNKTKDTLDKSVKSVGVVGTVAGAGVVLAAATTISPALITVKCVGAGAVGLHHVWNKKVKSKKCSNLVMPMNSFS
ncbi:hypothetical protein F0231_04125 [Vibrio sp. RE86]|uniref:hypothetical protein n=1 Tax=Vibrio sp. RE86 TaxID=2607605 RepID=UPI001493B893|nr:hypothetical protein [Vibrio sp. RE86]NOH78927.1 hypothetical protein [Vibrio sp. RE86]